MIPIPPWRVYFIIIIIIIINLAQCRFILFENVIFLDQSLKFTQVHELPSIFTKLFTLKAMPHGGDFNNEFAKIHQIYEKSYRAMEFFTKSL